MIWKTLEKYRDVGLRGACCATALALGFHLARVEAHAQASYEPTPEKRIQRDVDTEVEEIIIEAKKSGQVIGREAEEIDAFLYLSERDALIAFPKVDGSFDYLGFSTNNELARGWCQDLYQHYWDKAKATSTTDYVDRHLELMRKGL